MKEKKAFYLLLRYFSLIILALNNFYIISFIVTPLTIYASYFSLNLVYSEIHFIPPRTFFFADLKIELVEACIAVAAYYFLIILNLTTPMKIKKRIFLFAFTILSFFVLNVVRIFVFSILLEKNFHYFDLAHWLIWHFGSTLLLLVLWFAGVRIFKIKEIPVYSDFKEIKKDIKLRR